ncbi:Maintenance of ploidy protein mob2 [Erysiphe necator]|uniref:Putative mob1 phocein family protein n=1 Tax=Uncinula necator TaxID=52586 RepID=A0A0B1P2X5_UNCNE|nr:Maintenance of ploidy protein mob2 [Erysiphe necator]KHJ32633.1 putative mob1 phocein family protein [Erysiphe necator]
MSNLFSGISGRFRGSGKNGGSKSPGLSSPTSPTENSHNGAMSNIPPRVPQLPNSPLLSQNFSIEDNNFGQLNGDLLSHYNLPRPRPLWINDAYAKHIVKGNFMTLSTRPKTVEQGEWIAHQVVEHYRNLWNFVGVIHDKDEDGTSICNSSTCPRMSAGANFSFTWLNPRKEPVEVPAHEYISLMQRWISGKIDNTAIFPTDPNTVLYAPPPGNSNHAHSNLNISNSNSSIKPGSFNSYAHMGNPTDWIGKASGFPMEFFEVCQTIFRQMFRVYAHLYWSHFVDPFYHLSLEKSMNSCFSHFILTATEIDMLKPYELEPMQPLIDLWAANGTFPKESKAYAGANVKAGERLISLSGIN